MNRLRGRTLDSTVLPLVSALLLSGRPADADHEAAVDFDLSRPVPAPPAPWGPGA
jgi:hypothetical protein